MGEAQCGGSRQLANRHLDADGGSARGVLLPVSEESGLELALRTDALLMRIRSNLVTGDAGNLAESEADTSRLRLVLEGSRRFVAGDGATLVPSLNIGMRHDSGDAETGAGIEIDGGLHFTDPDLGLTVEGEARVLIAHQDSDYSQWGAGGSVRLDPGASGRGLSLTLAPTWGVASSFGRRFAGSRIDRAVGSGLPRPAPGRPSDLGPEPRAAPRL